MLLFHSVTFVISLFVINDMTTSTTLAKSINTHNGSINILGKRNLNQRNQSQVEFEDAYIKFSTSADDNEAIKELKCPVESIVTPRDDVNRSLSINQLLQYIDLSWYKDKKPFKRANGNLYDTKLDKLKLILFQLGKTDEGHYECHLDYSRVPPDVASKFKSFKKGALILLEIVISDPYIAPIITDPPLDKYVEWGTNVTLKCLRRETLQPQTTSWFRGCMLPNESQPCDRSLDYAIEDASRLNDLSPLVPFIIDSNNQDFLHINNVTEENIGFYGCAVHNELGMDTRKVVVNLINNHPSIHVRAQSSVPLETHNHSWLWYILVIIVFNVLAGGLAWVYYSRMGPSKKQTSPLFSIDKIGALSDKDSSGRRRLPDVEAPDIYNTGKSYDGFISGHFHQDVGHIFSQSMCANLLNNKASPSISSSNSHNSDEASSSWGKSSAHHGDHCRAIYSQSSNSTATTVPLYDHPPSTGTMRRCRTFVEDACVSNPSYGLLNPDNDTTEWNFPRRNLERLDKIGEGQFGEVWRYIARSKDGTGSTVAVKRLKDNIYTSDCERSELRAEIEIMKSVNNHPNVIKLLHCCIDGCGPILLIMEYADHGKLQTYLRNCRASRKLFSDRRNVTSKELIKFTYHIAKGMEYVASQGIVHRDLASRNILVSRENICKVADFGFARRVDDDCAYVRKSTNPVPVKWMAPEALEGNKFTHKSDVFSLGILMWEIVTLGATPYEQLTSEGVYKKVTTGGRLDRPPHCKDEFYTLMAECWAHDPALRPTFKDVALRLEKLLLSENDYIELDQYPEHAYYNIVNAAEKEVVQL